MDEKANCGSPHRGRVSFFARAKTILPGAKLVALRAPAGPAPGMARVKETKESTLRMAQRLPRLRGFGSRAAPTRHPVAAGQAQTSLSAPLRALAQSLTGLGCAIRVWKKTVAPLVFSGPRSRRRASPPESEEASLVFEPEARIWRPAS